MKIGLFVVEAGRMAGGPETYEVNLLRAIAALDKHNEYFVYCTHEGAAAAIGVEQDNFTYRVLKPSARWISVPLTLPAMLLRDGVQFFHSTMVPPPLSPKAYCLSILCFSNWAHPEFYPRHIVRRLNFLLEIGISKAHVLLCNSRNLQDYIRDAFKVPEDRMCVTYLGVGPEFAPMDKARAREVLRERHGIAYPYVLFVGKHQERKNVFRVIEAYARYRREARTEAKLLLVGRAPSGTDLIHQKISALGLEAHVERIAYIPYADLPYLYCGSDMFLFPSLWEGFGLPVIESMACGTPVITSNVTSLPEIAGRAAVIVDPEQVDQIAEGMLRLDRDTAFRHELISGGLERARGFTWESCAKATMDVYDRMAAR